MVNGKLVYNGQVAIEALQKILFPKITTYVKVEEGRAKSSMKLEIIKVVMLNVRISTTISTATLPEVGGESIPLWAPIAGAVWYLFYSFSSITKIKKIHTSTMYIKPSLEYS